jgi:hypothetical protein
MRQNKYEYDAFISHAVEDKIPIANELCAKLEMAGLKIWYSGKELGIGDSIEKTIEKGLNRSRYGIVILSPTYLAKNWTIREFYTLLAKEIEEQKVILPVLYNITLDELKNKDLLMADRFAVNAERGIDFVVERLVKEIRKSKAEKVRVAWFSRIWLVLIASLLTNVALLVKGNYSADLSPNAAPTVDARPPIQARSLSPIFDEMQGLFTQVAGCTCSHRNNKGESGPATRLVRQSTQNRYDPSEARNERDETPRQNAAHAKRGSKMTMAVVFQIEQSEPDEEQDLASEVDEMLQSIGMRETDDPFITVSNRESGEDGTHRGCFRASSIGE